MCFRPHCKDFLVYATALKRAENMRLSKIQHYANFQHMRENSSRYSELYGIGFKNVCFNFCILTSDK